VLFFAFITYLVGKAFIKAYKEYFASQASAPFPLIPLTLITLHPLSGPRPHSRGITDFSCPGAGLLGTHSFLVPRTGHLKSTEVYKPTFAETCIVVWFALLDGEGSSHT
jgi:hypothetical protein